MYLSSMYVDLGWHAFTSNLKSATKALQTYYLGQLTKNILLKTLSADSFFSRISVPNFGVNIGPLVWSMNFHASNYSDPMAFFS